MRSLQLNCAVVSAELYGSFSSTTKWLNLTWEKVFQKFMDIFCNGSLMPNSECSLIFASTTVCETYIMEILQKVGTILKKD